MSSRWVVDADNPQGHLVPMTPAEQTQFDADQTAAAQTAAAQAILDGNDATIKQTLQTRLAQIRAARTAIGNGAIFAALSTNEKAVIDGLLQDDIYLGRIVLELFDATT